MTSAEMTGNGKREFDKRLTAVRPSRRQKRQQEMEFYGFIHFTINTFTDREWGDGTEPESLFNPTDLDVNQWVETALKAGMKGLILTCKHHDGFCLWPSNYTDHTLAFSPYLEGRGDVVGALSQACQEAGLAFGIYLSPWDRNQKVYGSGKAYDDFFVGQLTELLTGYGPVFTVWLDGACGEGSCGKVQQYDWTRYYETVRKLQPEACISVSGPDIRWCGNEAGENRKSEWSVVPARLRDQSEIARNSQQADEEEFRNRRISVVDQDLGSRERMEGERDLIWYPSEVDVSIRPGWFYHKEEDDKLRSLDNLKDIYINSVGGNAMLLLNVPPGPSGMIAEGDQVRLMELGDWIGQTFCGNLADGLWKRADRHCASGGAGGSGLYSYFVNWNGPKRPSYLVVQEDISLGQRVERFLVKGILKGEETLLYSGTTIGYKKIIPIKGSRPVDEIWLIIEESRLEPQIKFFGVYS